MMQRDNRSKYALLGEIVLVMLVLTAVLAVFANAYWISTLSSAFAIAIAARGLSLLYGQVGLVSLCQVALIGIGGWVALRLGHAWGVSFELNVLLAGLSAALFGMLWGAPALRIKGLYLALVTLMLAGAFQTLISAVGFPDGGAGFWGRADAIQRVMLERPAWASGDVAYFIYTALWLTGMLLLVEWLRLGKAGRAWAFIRKGEPLAQSTGVNLFYYKMLAFGLAGFLAGVSGALLAGNVGQLDGRAFAASESLLLFALVIAGGAYHWYGALLAGLLMRAVPALLSDLNVDGDVAILVFGAALVHALITAPQGIAGEVDRLITGFKQRWRAKRLRGQHAPD